jgi:hypothetical protein
MPLAIRSDVEDDLAAVQCGQLHQSLGPREEGPQSGAIIPLCH